MSHSTGRPVKRQALSAEPTPSPNHKATRLGAFAARATQVGSVKREVALLSTQAEQQQAKLERLSQEEAADMKALEMFSGTASSLSRQTSLGSLAGDAARSGDEDDDVPDVPDCVKRTPTTKSVSANTARETLTRCEICGALSSTV